MGISHDLNPINPDRMWMRWPYDLWNILSLQTTKHVNTMCRCQRNLVESPCMFVNCAVLSVWECVFVFSFFRGLHNMYIYIYTSIYNHLYPFTSMYIHLYLVMFIWIYPCNMSMCLFIHLSIRLSTYPSFHPSLLFNADRCPWSPPYWRLWRATTTCWTAC